MRNLEIKEIEGVNFYTPADISKILKIDRQVVYRLIKSGTLVSFKFGGSYRILEQDLRKFISESKNNHQGV